MEAAKDDLLENFAIMYSKEYGFWAKAVLNIYGHEVTVKTDYIKSLDGVVYEIKNKISEAVVVFKVKKEVII